MGERKYPQPGPAGTKAEVGSSLIGPGLDLVFSKFYPYCIEYYF
jgi:hypothetical protein